MAKGRLYLMVGQVRRLRRSVSARQLVRVRSVSRDCDLGHPELLSDGIERKPQNLPVPVTAIQTGAGLTRPELPITPSLGQQWIYPQADFI
jgi:hypothetical protein